MNQSDEHDAEIGRLVLRQVNTRPAIAGLRMSCSDRSRHCELLARRSNELHLIPLANDPVNGDVKKLIDLDLDSVDRAMRLCDVEAFDALMSATVRAHAFDFDDDAVFWPGHVRAPSMRAEPSLPAGSGPVRRKPGGWCRFHRFYRFPAARAGNVSTPNADDGNADARASRDA